MARFVIGVMAKGASGVVLRSVTVNGDPGWVILRDGAPIAVATIEIDGERIRKVFATLNPDKLGHLRRTRSG